jgi:hypothetical protein
MPAKQMTPEAILVKGQFIKAFNELRYRNKVSSKKEFCKLVGLASASNLKRIETSETCEPTITQLCLLIKNFKISVEWLMIGRGEFIKKN